MKIFYGVQATGNGHISRARAMHPALEKQGFNVDYLFSGRAQEQLFDMSIFGQFACKSGLTFVTDAGKIKPIATVTNNKIGQLFHDIRSLDLSSYDLVISDFDPISAWAARRQKIPCICIGHQYAFLHNIPKKGNNFFTQLLMKYFAPATISLGLHWHHFDQTILPPILDMNDIEEPIIDNKILVYLSFEKVTDIIELLKPFTEYQFFIYADIEEQEHNGNIHLHPLSRDSFKRDLANCNGVITNAGFELASEAIHLGKKILVKPLLGQMEQLSNALALEQLALGLSMKTLDSNIVDTWLKMSSTRRIIYPDVAEAIAQWIAKGNWNSTKALSEDLWKQTIQISPEKVL